MAGIKNFIQINNMQGDFQSETKGDTILERDLALKAKMIDPFQNTTYCYFCGKEVIIEDSGSGRTVSTSLNEKAQKAHTSCLNKFLEEKGVKV